MTMHHDDKPASEPMTDTRKAPPVSSDQLHAWVLFAAHAADSLDAAGSAAHADALLVEFNARFHADHPND